MSELPIFDKHKQRTFSHILDIMGENAVWERSETGETEEGRILFNYPTKPKEIDQYEYPPEKPVAEWYKDTFIGLKELCDSQSNEYLIVRGDRYFVTQIETKFDGETYIANLELATE